jgi:uncharacterized protein YegL
MGQPRLLFALVIDSTLPDDARSFLERATRVLKMQLMRDAAAHEAAELAVVSFGNPVTVLSDFALVPEFAVPAIPAAGPERLMGQGIDEAMDMIHKKAVGYVQDGHQVRIPNILLITGGEPHDIPLGSDKWKWQVQFVQQIASQNRISLCALGPKESYKFLQELCTPQSLTGALDPCFFPIQFDDSLIGFFDFYATMIWPRLLELEDAG